VVAAADGTPIANAVRGSRKDLRDAVRAARNAYPGWADRTAMNRGQILYRVAELMEGRRDQFVAEVGQADGVRADKAREIVDRSIDRWVWYAGWADKIAQVLGSSNPVASDFFNFTIPEPTGIVGVVAPESSSLLGLVSRLAPPLVAGNSVVVLASETRPLPAISLTEVLATSDVPGGVVNVITGRKRELVPVLAGHSDVDSIDVWGVPDDLRTDVELAAADSVKRVVRRPSGVTDARFDWLDDRASERPEWIAAYLEMKTVWHPIGV
jgi:acyl-CoA reductase-like NAD-dependent aldehyde dehydrogenase